jgi:cytoskeletal protein CcmA (bactofilin family)
MFGSKSKKTKVQNKPKPAPVSVTPQSSVVVPAARQAPEPVPLEGPGAAFVNIGRSVHIKGELTGNEDLTIDGKVEGSIHLRDHNLTISANGHITAEVFAKSAVIFGHVLGDIRAEDRIEIARGGFVEGDLFAPKVVITDGARFKGRVDMISDSSAAPSQSWGDPVGISAFDEAPDDFVDDIIDEIVEENPPQQGSGAKQKSKKQGQKGSKPSNADPKLSGMFEEFDPANP